MDVLPPLRKLAVSAQLRAIAAGKLQTSNYKSLVTPQWWRWLPATLRLLQEQVMSEQDAFIRERWGAGPSLAQDGSFLNERPRPR